jgi:hypothetical protein
LCQALEAKNAQNNNHGLNMKIYHLAPMFYVVSLFGCGSGSSSNSDPYRGTWFKGCSIEEATSSRQVWTEETIKLSNSKYDMYARFYKDSECTEVDPLLNETFEQLYPNNYVVNIKNRVQKSTHDGYVFTEYELDAPYLGTIYISFYKVEDRLYEVQYEENVGPYVNFNIYYNLVN